MRVLICGDRDWWDDAMIHLDLERLANDVPKLTIIEGCARGADRVAHMWNCRWSEHLHFPANWREFGRAAGPIRNQEMLIEGQPDLVIAYHDDLDNSKGTAHMVRIARKMKVPVEVRGH